MSHSPPRLPLADWPVQLQLPFGYVWYTEPGALVTQCSIERATLEHAVSITECVDRVIELEREELTLHGGLLILHDWRMLRSHEPEARNHVFSATRRRRAGDVRAIVTSLTLNPLLSMAVEAGNALLEATTGRVVQVVPSISPALGRYGVRKPGAQAKVPSRYPTSSP